VLIEKPWRELVDEVLHDEQGIDLPRRVHRPGKSNNDRLIALREDIAAACRIILDVNLKPVP